MTQELLQAGDDELINLVSGGDTQKRKPTRHTGKITAKRTELVQGILKFVAEGFSQRRIARLLGVSTHTVQVLVERATASGELASLKQRVSSKLGRCIELGIDEFLDALQAGNISPAQLPVAIGILSDKKAILDGDPTVIIRHEYDLSRDDFETYLAALPEVSEPPGKPLTLNPVPGSTVAGAAVARVVEGDPSPGSPESETGSQPTVSE